MEKLDKKIFITLFFSILAAVMGVGIVVPLLPVYAHDLGASGVYIGLIFGAFSLSRTFLLPYFGRLSDQKGRKPLIVTGLFAYALVSISFILSETVETLILLRFLQGIASAMIMPVSLAYVADITPIGREGFSMGLFNMSVFIGLSIGPLMGGVIKDRFSLQGAFACMGGLAFLGFLLSLFFLPATKSERVVNRKKKPIGWQHILKDRAISGLFFFRFTYTACIGIIWGFLPIFADSEFSLSSSSIGVLVMLAVLISGLIHTPMGILADRLNRVAMVAIGGVMTSAAILSFGWARGFWDLFLANVLFGLGGGVAMPALMALAVSKGNRTDAMGSVMALLTMAHSMGMLIGSLLAGVTMDIFQLRQAFPFGSLIMMIGVGVFIVCSYPTPEQPEPNRF
jgi:DHA1 family multidrug resistance protein-like MFS transporter